MSVKVQHHIKFREPQIGVIKKIPVHIKSIYADKGFLTTNINTIKTKIGLEKKLSTTETLKEIVNGSTNYAIDKGTSAINFVKKNATQENVQKYLNKETFHKITQENPIATMTLSLATAFGAGYLLVKLLHNKDNDKDSNKANKDT